MLTIAPPVLGLHDRRHEPGRPDDVQEVHVEAGVPLLVGELEHGRARSVAGAVDERVDASPAVHRGVDEAAQVVVRLVRAGDADAAELGGERLALAGRGEDRDAEAVRREPARGSRADAAAALR